MVANTLPALPSPRFPIEGETAREHIGNAIQILNAAPRTALNGKYLSPEDACALSMRLLAALAQLDRKRP